ncbi:nitrate reductase cytochrome c-type subunit [Motilimonas pumila]|uniref:Periplasmic nitrate reductase, electron transfer subunit n=1 Tax=Motilimonas pumila TaxID=2303987 RepID=A0A418YG76_9GAMM|nr:nitrate reductase cytochrome c-type subunit [Motilimonas pumila]RJG48489.1 nitrate reductase cytochrome c-type subunit [Motilimonas pumila]
MKIKLLATALCALMLSAPSWSEQDEADNNVNNGGVSSLRGNVELDTQQDPGRIKQVQRDRPTMDREYVHQPPLIPHQIRHYKVDMDANKCLSCHSWKNASETGGTRISPTHYETRDGMTLSDVSPRRYFCLQCHVPQADAKPLVENDFKPVESLR